MTIAGVNDLGSDSKLGAVDGRHHTCRGICGDVDILATSVVHVQG
jgi:hypothetical protein